MPYHFKLSFGVCLLVMLMAISIPLSSTAVDVVGDSSPRISSTPTEYVNQSPIGLAPANLYWVFKDLAAEGKSYPMAGCKISPAGPAPQCKPHDLKVSERNFYFNKAQKSVVGETVSWDLCSTVDVSQYEVRVAVLCASVEVLVKDLNF